MFPDWLQTLGIGESEGLARDKDRGGYRAWNPSSSKGRDLERVGHLVPCLSAGALTSMFWSHSSTLKLCL